MRNQAIVGAFTLLLFVCPTFAQSDKTSTSKTEAEVRKFFDDYGDDLRQHRKEAIADRYDRSGGWRMGGGRKIFTTWDEVRNLYTTKWVGPKSFAWKDLSVEVLSPNAAVVIGLFEWPNAAGDIRTFSYTGLVVKKDGKWRIRIEDENGAPVRPSTAQ